MAEKSKILIIGATGYIGKFIVEASAKAGHPAFALVREKTFSNPYKSKIIDSFKSLGVTVVHRFLPSEFGTDVDRSHAVEAAASAFGIKAKIRRIIEDEGIPHTFVFSNCYAGYFLPNVGQTDFSTTSREKVSILGDGNTKGESKASLDCSLVCTCPSRETL